VTIFNISSSFLRQKEWDLKSETFVILNPKE